MNISVRRGERKRPVPEARLLPRHGISGDAHAGNWHRQVSLLAEESVDAMRPLCPVPLDDGIFAENIRTAGIVLKDLPVGTCLRVGTAVLEVTQIGKECHSGCAIRQAAGQCVMPTEGIFAAVVREGTVRPGDCVELAGETDGTPQLAGETDGTPPHRDGPCQS